MYEEVFRLDDGARLRVVVWLYMTVTCEKPRWSVDMYRCEKGCRTFLDTGGFTVGEVVTGEYATQVKSALNSAWLEIKPEPIK